MTISQNQAPSLDRVMIFIDGSNLYNSLRTGFARTDLDYGRFVAKLAAGRRLVRTYYYGARVDRTRQPEQYRGQQRFLWELSQVPRLELRLERLVYRNWPESAPLEKGVDIKLATDMLLHAAGNNYEVAVLVSGDTDFVDMVRGVKSLGKNVELTLFSRSGSQSLREVADEVVEIDRPFLENCWQQ